LSSSTLTYAIITPVRNEADNLGRLAACVAAQGIRPELWMLVDNGSTDQSLDIADRLAEKFDFIRAQAGRSDSAFERGGPVTRAFQRGLDALDALPDVVVKMDADVSFEDDHFQQLLSAFRDDSSLGMASGSCYERDDEQGPWRQRFGTSGSVWGAIRAYRRECLLDVLPLEEEMGWDGIDELKAQAHGWRTLTLLDLPFRHHRREGERDGSRYRAWHARGRASHYMGYRPTYLVIRAVHPARVEPAALAMLVGYVRAVLTRRSQYEDRRVRASLRRQQRLRNLPARRREALGRHA
jgi:biofilm PGA synthesis N-glycosyltransferase PgaC